MAIDTTLYKLCDPNVYTNTMQVPPMPEHMKKKQGEHYIM